MVIFFMLLPSRISGSLYSDAIAFQNYWNVQIWEILPSRINGTFQFGKYCHPELMGRSNLGNIAFHNYWKPII